MACYGGDVVDAVTARLWLLAASGQPVQQCVGGTVVVCADNGLLGRMPASPWWHHWLRPCGGSPATPWWWGW
jgi:hypothetical protein